MDVTRAQQLFQFIEHSPSCFHTVLSVRKELTDSGFTELQESKKWLLQPGGKYFVTRNQSSVIAFKIPEEDYVSFHIVASHSDSPTYRLKEHAEHESGSHYVQLNTEGYGGMICSTWFDRPLSLAGRVILRTENGVQAKPIAIDRDLVLIPNLAIHMNREINNGYHYNAQVDMLPLFGEGDAKGELKKIIAEAAGAAPEDVLASDLFLWNRQKGSIWGAHNEFISCPKLDDLECVFTSLQAFLSGHNDRSASVYCVFDNEEVGSGTKQGAKSTFLYDILQRINAAMHRTPEDFYTTLASSFMLSADNAHAAHPNHPEKTDADNCVYMNGGIVIKYNANQKYCTDAVSAGIFKTLCDRAQVPCQFFHNRSDMAGGSTLGNLSNAQVSLNTIDIGLAQLAMHSSYETAGIRDLDFMIRGIEAFYNACIEADADGSYTVR